MKFYQKSAAERRAQLVSERALTPEDAKIFAVQNGLPADIAAHLVENQISQLTLPVGIARDLQVNGHDHQVPMVTEEPSVIAAASNGARIARLNGGVSAQVASHLIHAEVVFDRLPKPDQAAAMIVQRQEELFTVASAAHPSAVSRGGGLKKVTVAQIARRFFKITLTIDPSESMGANLANTIAEAIGATTSGWFGQAPLVSVLSNEGVEIVDARVQLDPATLATKTSTGREIAQKIAAVSDLAFVDASRATTHNKGIMNGIEAAVLATGNDTRAVAIAALHFAQITGAYQPLTRWWLENDQLYGQIQVPIPIGIVGGASNALPIVAPLRRLGSYEDIATAQKVIAALGLVQNLAALRALVGPGIQAGHMNQQANALAISAGATGAAIDYVVKGLQDHPKTLANATMLLKEFEEMKGERSHENRD